MSTTAQQQEQAVFVARGEDRAGDDRGMGISALRVKVTSDDTGGRLLVVEQEMNARGGPPRHVHAAQDEWFYALEGEFVVEVGDARHELHAGDAVLAPRAVPHAWACTSEGGGRLLIVFTPAGAMEGFYREVTRTAAMPTQAPELWRSHGLEVVGPPLPLP